VPSKDRGKRFAAGDLAHVPDNEVQELQFWTLFPTSQALQNAKVFLLGQVSLILSEGKPCQSAEENPYHANGRTALLKAP